MVFLNNTIIPLFFLLISLPSIVLPNISSQAFGFGLCPHFTTQDVVNYNSASKIYHCGDATFAEDHEMQRANASKLRHHAR
jgi:hypothetical protein